LKKLRGTPILSDLGVGLRDFLCGVPMGTPPYNLLSAWTSLKLDVPEKVIDDY
jgi:hypothetical protein